MKYLDDEYELSTGKKFYAHTGVLGIRKGDKDISYGWDGGISEGVSFTPGELREIADYMIECWQQFREEL